MIQLFLVFLEGEEGGGVKEEHAKKRSKSPLLSCSVLTRDREF